MFRHVPTSFLHESRRQFHLAARCRQSDEKLYEHHIPTTPLQKLILGVGSSVMGLVDPWRGDMVAVSGEVTAGPVLELMRRRLEQHREGAEILRQRPRINTHNIDFDRLRSLPPNTLGRTYADHSDAHGITPDEREPVRFVDDADLAYVLQRYRDVHDILHAVLEMPTNLVGEVAVKWVEALQNGLPMCAGAALLAPARFSPKQAKQFAAIRPWAVATGTKANVFLNIFFERRWEQDMNDFRKEMNYKRPPSLRVRQ